MKIVTDIDCRDLIPLIDKKWLVSGLWRLAGRKDEGEKKLKELARDMHKFGLNPKLIYQSYDSKLREKFIDLFIGKRKVASFEIKRDILEKMNKTRISCDNAFVMCATLGEDAGISSARKFENGEYAEYFYLYGFSAALTEALAEYGHRLICRDADCDRKKSFRISPGYSVWPDLGDQKKIAGLLPIGEIGVSVSETNLLIPEFSITAVGFW